MKVAEYNQMMAYLMRPKFNGGGYVKKRVLPKKKPEEEVKKRKLENFEKAKPALENPKEVKEMIDKPKRGLVDEPGSYAGENLTVTEVNKYRKQGLKAKDIAEKLDTSLTTYERFLTANKSKLVPVKKILRTGTAAADVRAFLKKAKKGSTVDVAKYLDEVAETQAERNQLNADFKRIVKEFKNKNLKLKLGITGRKPKLEGKIGQIVEALQDLPKGSKVDYIKLSDDLNLGDEGSSLIGKAIKSRKELQNKTLKL